MATNIETVTEEERNREAAQLKLENRLIEFGGKVVLISPRGVVQQYDSDFWHDLLPERRAEVIADTLHAGKVDALNVLSTSLRGVFEKARDSLDALQERVQKFAESVDMGVECVCVDTDEEDGETRLTVVLK